LRRTEFSALLKALLKARVNLERFDPRQADAAEAQENHPALSFPGAASARGTITMTTP